MLHLKNKIIFSLLFIISLSIYFPCFAQENKKSIVIYYSLIKNQPIENLDANSSCSRIIYDDKLMGYTEFIAKEIQEKTNSDIGYIINSKTYSSDYQKTLAQTQEEKQKYIKPSILTTFNVDDYDEIYLGFPIWWYSIPMAVISFLQNEQLDGKKIYIFCTSKETGASNFSKEIQTMLPKCNVYPIVLNVKTDKNQIIEKIISNWLEKIN